MGFDYFYGRGTEPFAFLQVPRVLIEDERFADITTDAKFLYSFMLNAYSDKLTITANSIAYEYKPYLKSDNSFNVYRKWSYKTTNSTLGLAFEKIAVAVDEILSRDQEAMYCDCGTIDFIVTYEDGNKVVREFGVPADEFAECFKIVREIIPVSEEIPEAIRISEDCDDEDE